MLRCGDRVRLTTAELEELVILGGVKPTAIETVDQLERFLRRRVDELAALERLGALSPEGVLCSRLLAGRLKALV